MCFMVHFQAISFFYITIWQNLDAHPPQKIGEIWAPSLMNDKIWAPP